MKKFFLATLIAMLVLTGALAALAADPVTVKLGITASFYEDVWAPAKAELAKEGINLEYVSFSDFVTPNRVLDEGEIDIKSHLHY